MNGHDPRQDSDSPATMRARDLFDRASTRVDAVTANRLRITRREALAPVPRARRRAWIPAGAAMAAVLAIGLAWWLPEQAAVVPVDVAHSDASDPAWAADEDADVYAWLGDAPVAIESPKEGAL